MTRPLLVLFAVFASVLVCIESRADDAIPKHAQKFLGQYCVRCHGAKVQKADFRLDDLGAIDAGTAPQWKKVLERLSLGEMPPPDEVQPSLSETDPVTTWINEGLEKANRRRVESRRSTHSHHSSFGSSR